MNSARPSLRSCHCCGLIQRMPTLAAGEHAVCARCASRLGHGDPRRTRLAAMLALSALALYPAAMLLPLLRIEKLGHLREDSLVSGVVTLWGQGYWLVGSVVFLFSVLLPPLKLFALLWLSLGRPGRGGRKHALVYRLVEGLGRWGMLDVMLVAILLAMVKLGGLVNIHAGAGLLAFTLLVLTSLLASLVFNPQTLWQEATEPEHDGTSRQS